MNERSIEQRQRIVGAVWNGLLQRKCDCGQHTVAGGKCDECGKKHLSLQRATRNSELGTRNSDSVPPIVHEVLRSPGQPLDAATRSFFEPRFGHDFSRVRVHADGEAAGAASAVFARAYTVGSHIAFGSGEYAPATAKGKRLLAHELTHVVQQSSIDNQSLSAQLRVGEADDPHEHEADRIADAVIGAASPVSRAALVLDSRGETIRRTNGGGKAPATPSWTVAELKKLVTDCDGGLGIWAKAKKANGDKDPVVNAGKTTSGGQTSGSTITLEETSDRCTAVQVLIQELSNMSRQKDLDKLASDGVAGDLARDAFIKGIEKIEYETGVKNVLTAFDACKDTWKCKTAEKEWARKAKDFDDYFDKFLAKTHKEGYGKWWDDNCKTNYDKKHAKK